MRLPAAHAPRPTAPADITHHRPCTALHSHLPSTLVNALERRLTAQCRQQQAGTLAGWPAGTQSQAAGHRQAGPARRRAQLFRPSPRSLAALHLAAAAHIVHVALLAEEFCSVLGRHARVQLRLGGRAGRQAEQLLVAGSEPGGPGMRQHSQRSRRSGPLPAPARLACLQRLAHDLRSGDKQAGGTATGGLSHLPEHAAGELRPASAGSTGPSTRLRTARPPSPCRPGCRRRCSSGACGAALAPPLPDPPASPAGGPAHMLSSAIQPQAMHALARASRGSTAAQCAAAGSAAAGSCAAVGIASWVQGGSRAPAPAPSRRRVHSRRSRSWLRKRGGERRGRRASQR